MLGIAQIDWTDNSPQGFTTPQDAVILRLLNRSTGVLMPDKQIGIRQDETGKYIDADLAGGNAYVLQFSTRNQVDGRRSEEGTVIGNVVGITNLAFPQIDVTFKNTSIVQLSLSPNTPNGNERVYFQIINPAKTGVGGIERWCYPTYPKIATALITLSASQPGNGSATFGQTGNTIQLHYGLVNNTGLYSPISIIEIVL